MVEIRGLSKRYPGTWALKDLSLDVEKGRILGVLGLNGCGKSTLFRILAGVTRPTRGSVRINGEAVGIRTKRIVSYSPEVDPHYSWMTVGEQLRYLASFYPNWDDRKSSELMDLLELNPQKKLSVLSKGIRARVKIVAAFSRPSSLVLLDEPLGGIDAPSRKRVMKALFSEYRTGSQSVMISTHLVSEVEEFVEDVVFLKEGSSVLKGNADELRGERGSSLSEVLEATGKQAAQLTETGATK